MVYAGAFPDMICISSYRPRDQSETIFQLQVTAKKTWDKVFQEIVYFGAPNEALETPRTKFIECDSKPRIKDMAQVASRSFSWAAIINADIQVSERAKHLDRVLNMYKAACGFSFRIPVGGTEKKDLGLDVFFARGDIWVDVAQQIPDVFQMGKIQWDTWLASFFMTHWPVECYDLSPSKLFFHPEHGERGDQHLVISDPYLKNMRWNARPLRF